MWFVLYNESMRFEVPQFIEIEDKIFGPFTWRQFVYLGGGVGMGIVTFLVFPKIIFALVGLPLAGLGFLLAFYPVNNRPFSVFLESVFTFYRGRRMYHWKKKNDTIYRGDPSGYTPQSLSATLKKPTAPVNNINSLSRRLELTALQKKN